MTAARMHPDDLEELAELVAEKLAARGVRVGVRAPKPAEPVQVSETDRAAAREYARRLGMPVRVKDRKR